MKANTTPVQSTTEADTVAAAFAAAPTPGAGFKAAVNEITAIRGLSEPTDGIRDFVRSIERQLSAAKAADFHRDGYNVRQKSSAVWCNRLGDVAQNRTTATRHELQSEADRHAAAQAIVGAAAARSAQACRLADEAFAHGESDLSALASRWSKAARASAAVKTAERYGLALPTPTGVLGEFFAQQKVKAATERHEIAFTLANNRAIAASRHLNDCRIDTERQTALVKSGLETVKRLMEAAAAADKESETLALAAEKAQVTADRLAKSKAKTATPKARAKADEAAVEAREAARSAILAAKTAAGESREAQKAILEHQARLKDVRLAFDKAAAAADKASAEADRAEAELTAAKAAANG
jgi:hypothetical protein